MLLYASPTVHASVAWLHATLAFIITTIVFVSNIHATIVFPNPYVIYYNTMKNNNTRLADIVFRILLLNGSLDISSPSDLFSIVSLLALGCISKDDIKHAFVFSKEEWTWVDVQKRKKMRASELKEIATCLNLGVWKKKDVLSKLSELEKSLQYFPAEAIRKILILKEETKARMKVVDRATQLFEHYGGPQTVEDILREYDRASIKYVTCDNLLAAYMQDRGRRITWSTCSRILCLTDSDMVDIPYERVPNPYYRTAPYITLYSFDACLNASCLKYGDLDGVAERRDQILEEKINRKRRKQSDE